MTCMAPPPMAEHFLVITDVGRRRKPAGLNVSLEGSDLRGQIQTDADASLIRNLKREDLELLLS
jgi:hypothetical protein